MCLILMTMACSKKKGPGDENPDPKSQFQGRPIQVARGALKGTAITASIGAAGGTIRTADNMVVVTVPAGAVATAQTFSIQPVENTLQPGSENPVYRLLPENITFAKPVTVTVKYNPATLTEGGEDVLCLAYQTPEGKWKSTRAGLDKTAKTLTVDVLHFCDFAFYNRFELFFDKKELGKGEKANLMVGYQPDDFESEDLLAPLSLEIPDVFDGGTGKYYAEVIREHVTRVVGWRVVIGGGTVEQRPNSYGINANAQYTAPNEITKITDAMVEVTLEGLSPIYDTKAPGGKRILGTLILRKKIRLMPDNYVRMQFSGADYVFSEGTTGQVIHGMTGITGINSTLKMALAINVGSAVAGTFSCGLVENNSRKAHVSWTYSQGNTPAFASSTYCEGQDGNSVQMFSNATCKLTRVGNVGEFIEGEFAGLLYQAKPNTQNCQFEQKQVTVFFRVKRVE